MLKDLLFFFIDRFNLRQKILSGKFQ